MDVSSFISFFCFLVLFFVVVCSNCSCFYRVVCCDDRFSSSVTFYGCYLFFFFFSANIRIYIYVCVCVVERIMRSFLYAFPTMLPLTGQQRKEKKKKLESGKSQEDIAFAFTNLAKKKKWIWFFLLAKLTRV